MDAKLDKDIKLVANTLVSYVRLLQSSVELVLWNWNIHLFTLHTQVACTVQPRLSEQAGTGEKVRIIEGSDKRGYNIHD